MVYPANVLCDRDNSYAMDLEGILVLDLIDYRPGSRSIEDVEPHEYRRGYPDPAYLSGSSPHSANLGKALEERGITPL